MKISVQEFIDGYKKKSNSYWQKIKDALNKVNGKVQAVEKDVLDVGVKLDHFHQERVKDREIIN